MPDEARGSVPERIRWVVDHLAVRPDDHVLEIGCGPGVALSLVCDRLDGGHATAIDRSPTAVRRTRDRNAAHVAAGRATIEEVALADVPPGRFDVVFAVNVNVFWVQPTGPEVARLGELLRPGGVAHLCYEAPAAARADQVATTVTTALGAQGFAPAVTTGATPAMVCVCSAPSRR